MSLFNLGMDSAAAAATEGSRPAKRAKDEEGQKKKPSEEDYKKLVALTSKLTLSNAQNVRTLNGVSLIVYQLATESTLAEALRSAGRAYKDKAETLDNEARFKTIGLPHHHLWVRLLNEAHQYNKDKLQNANVQKELESYQQFLASYGSSSAAQWMELSHGIRLCKTAKCFDKSKVKLLLAIQPGTKHMQVWEAAVRVVFSQMPGVTYKPGAAPRGNLEIRIQELLDTLNI
eukprot:TRINITY_DN23135_c0_g1_i1.p2 TRINITY_DN23135_c0_g1~~TRINITY_DN23135_c0_g1_i1.p2  ORF type:complete len:231 (+),score=67.26 TRINITY_DN23135_c0_g1_i1:617-1309(+)